MNAHYTLYLGSKRYSSWSLRPWLAMAMAGLRFEETVIALYTPDTKTRINAHSPSGKVPALAMAEDGRTHMVWDSMAICETLAERHPEARLWADDPMRRAEARSISAEMHAGFPDLRKLMPMEVGVRHPMPETTEELVQQIARITAIWEDALARFAADGGFLFGRFSIADCFYAPVVTRFETYGIALPAHAAAYADRILALAPMRAWRQAGLAEPARTDQP